MTKRSKRGSTSTFASSSRERPSFRAFRAISITAVK
jgi:hypothetical protein